MAGDGYDNITANSVRRGLEGADQYTIAATAKRATQGLAFIDTDIIQPLAQDSVAYRYVENPASNDFALIAPRPETQSDGELVLHGYFNPDVDLSTFTQVDVENLNSDNGPFSGNIYKSIDGTVNDRGDEFYVALIGTGKETGGNLGVGSTIAIEPGDSLLQVVENSIVSNDVNISFQAVFLEQDDENLL
jgi:hypothetical protein